MARKITMSDIAAAAGVSQSTVSLVLNGSTSVKIADATKRKVIDTAESLGYNNKKVAHALGRPKKMAFVINGLTSYDPFIDAINSAREEAWANDYILVTFNYSHDAVMANKIESEINGGDYVGLVYASSMTRELKQQRVNTFLPTILLNCTNQADDQIPSILPADMIGAYKAVSHLTAQGYRYIAMLCGENWMQASKQRTEGYRQALIDADIIPNPDYLREANWSLKEAHQQTLALFNLAQPPEAIFCSSDYMAMGCYQALAELGLKIPDDVAVVGYDNQQIASESFPALTSVELPYSEMGKLAIESLVTQMEGQPLVSKRRKVEGELVVRASSSK
ncbi:LacI family DNA-binding transcriptional regulator [Vibrio sp. Isolate25]|uniref:LacI family DNA-binding transcriptional regulator n=1 Tax=Vibrio TaxID=662 RepID=UPI001EFC7506|nr:MULTISPECIES: LacI family DNA-binding transcriptional regulator [Vibrio]MCG9598862.1 LacI family DNA-binding transcriptional regulator [Vibrio sp. Isolate25]MCG9680812.1 LacI family DNA-binding transcriptional regulator [Vibrio sp. Isolate24]USD33083.1 LacI family DNA-binding transcriptional regulator [Vibrio sp. SCSIO 43186]USD46152.1 LacI family DNA-binding transcriptional regulator [Vibrio sp. SCSIO 43145]USD70207.1 LacI family DNA-binding transcriptional regulator [Vibrio sp. SCSIO 4313